MAKVKLVRSDAPVLRDVAHPIEEVTLATELLIRSMSRVMRLSRGIGLAANQVGYHHSLFIYDVGEGIKVAINPMIHEVSEEVIQHHEGCLSLPDKSFTVPRHKMILASWVDNKGNAFKEEVTGLKAIVFQHEIDHLGGKLLLDY